MKFGLNDLTYEKICGIFSEYADIEEVIIYGSRVLGTFNAAVQHRPINFLKVAK